MLWLVLLLVFWGVFMVVCLSCVLTYNLARIFSFFCFVFCYCCVFYHVLVGIMLMFWLLLVVMLVLVFWLVALMYSYLCFSND